MGRGLSPNEINVLRVLARYNLQGWLSRKRCYQYVKVIQWPEVFSFRNTAHGGIRFVCLLPTKEDAPGKYIRRRKKLDSINTSISATHMRLIQRGLVEERKSKVWSLLGLTEAGKEIAGGLNSPLDIFGNGPIKVGEDPGAGQVVEIDQVSIKHVQQKLF